jgi:hypothetical protein
MIRWERAGSWRETVVATSRAPFPLALRRLGGMSRTNQVEFHLAFARHCSAMLVAKVLYAGLLNSILKCMARHAQRASSRCGSFRGSGGIRGGRGIMGGILRL